MLHERLQGHIVCEDGLRALCPDTAVRPGARRMCSRRVQLGQQETRLRASVIADDETGEREAVGNEVLHSIC